MTQTLYVAVNNNGVIVNDNDIRNLGPVFTYADVKVGIDQKYALHIDENGGKQGAFDILDCQLVGAASLAKIYCTKHSIEIASRCWVERDNWRNTYEVVGTDGVEYHFHLSRGYDCYGRQVGWDFVYISTKKDGEISIGQNITSIGDI